jgi:hypothetical protein
MRKGDRETSIPVAGTALLLLLDVINDLLEPEHSGFTTPRSIRC